jgi:hypothetical protein
VQSRLFLAFIVLSSLSHGIGSIPIGADGRVVFFFVRIRTM